MNPVENPPMVHVFSDSHARMLRHLPIGRLAELSYLCNEFKSHAPKATAHRTNARSAQYERTCGPTQPNPSARLSPPSAAEVPRPRSY